MHMSLTTLSRAAILPLTLTLSLNPLVSIAARTSYHNQLQSSSHLKYRTTTSSPFHPQSPSFLHSHSYSTMSTDQTSKNNPTTDTDTNQHQQPDNPTPQDQQKGQEQLALPDASSATNQLDLSGGGSTAKLDHLGPMVVNTDGTLARITNWEHMTEGEKQATLRVLGKRNKQRLEALKAARGEGEGQGQGQ